MKCKVEVLYPTESDFECRSTATCGSIAKIFYEFNISDGHLGKIYVK